jgi:prolyl-tRNA editing enzyme YbaK/EbsC (Cys-tRNA(Pro) deacylase)
MASGPERVQAALLALGLDTQVVRVPGSAKTAQLAADSVGCAVGAIVKSLVFVVDGTPVLVLCAGDRRVDAAKLAALRGAESAGMAPATVVREATGYAIGGVPPLGHATALPIYMDEAVLRWPRVYGAAGAPDALFPIESATLLAVTGADVVDVSEA